MTNKAQKELQVRRLLAGDIQHNNTLLLDDSCGGATKLNERGISWPEEERNDLVYLAGTYSLDYLKAVIWWAENMEVEKKIGDQS